jgi:hypothetical protein
MNSKIHFLTICFTMSQKFTEAVNQIWKLQEHFIYLEMVNYYYKTKIGRFPP